MVRTGNVDFSCKRLTSIEIRKSKYRIIRRVRFRWDSPPPPPPPPRKISGSALGLTHSQTDKLKTSKLKEFVDHISKFDKNVGEFSKRVETLWEMGRNTSGKGEITLYEPFLLFP